MAFPSSATVSGRDFFISVGGSFNFYAGKKGGGQDTRATFSPRLSTSSSNLPNSLGRSTSSMVPVNPNGRLRPARSRSRCLRQLNKVLQTEIADHAACTLIDPHAQSHHVKLGAVSCHPDDDVSRLRAVLPQWAVTRSVSSFLICSSTRFRVSVPKSTPYRTAPILLASRNVCIEMAPESGK